MDHQAFLQNSLPGLEENRVGPADALSCGIAATASPLGPLLRQPALRKSHDAAAVASVVIGELIALADAGATALVTYPGQPGPAAMRALTAVDLDGQHIGGSVLLVFEHGDSARPIVTGVIRKPNPLPRQAPEHVSVEADGARLVVHAREKLVLQCGEASITLTQAGKVLIRGTFISSRSAGLNRITGGSVQLN